MPEILMEKKEFQEILTLSIREELKPISEEVRSIKAYILGDIYQEGVKGIINTDHAVVRAINDNLTIPKANKASRYVEELDGIKAKEYMTELIASEAVSSAEMIKDFKKTWKLGVSAIAIINIPSIITLVQFSIGLIQYFSKFMK